MDLSALLKVVPNANVSIKSAAPVATTATTTSASASAAGPAAPRPSTSPSSLSSSPDSAVKLPAPRSNGSKSTGTNSQQQQHHHHHHHHHHHSNPRDRMNPGSVLGASEVWHNPPVHAGSVPTARGRTIGILPVTASNTSSATDNNNKNKTAAISSSSNDRDGHRGAASPAPTTTTAASSPSSNVNIVLETGVRNLSQAQKQQIFGQKLLDPDTSSCSATHNNNNNSGNDGTAAAMQDSSAVAPGQKVGGRRRKSKSSMDSVASGDGNNNADTNDFDEGAAAASAAVSTAVGKSSRRQQQQQQRQQQAHSSSSPSSNAVAVRYMKEPNATGCTVHVKFLPLTMTEGELMTLLSSFGPVARVRICNRDKNTIWTYCFVEFLSRDAAARCVAHVTGVGVKDKEGASFELQAELAKFAIGDKQAQDYDVESGALCCFGNGPNRDRTLNAASEALAKATAVQAKNGAAGSAAAAAAASAAADGASEMNSRNNGTTTSSTMISASAAVVAAPAAAGSSALLLEQTVARANKQLADAVVKGLSPASESALASASLASVSPMLRLALAAARSAVETATSAAALLLQQRGHVAGAAAVAMLGVDNTLLHSRIVLCALLMLGGDIRQAVAVASDAMRDIPKLAQMIQQSESGVMMTMMMNACDSENGTESSSSNSLDVENVDNDGRRMPFSEVAANHLAELAVLLEPVCSVMSMCLLHVAFNRACVIGTCTPIAALRPLLDVHHSTKVLSTGAAASWSAGSKWFLANGAGNSGSGANAASGGTEEKSLWEMILAESPLDLAAINLKKRRDGAAAAAARAAGLAAVPAVPEKSVPQRLAETALHVLGFYRPRLLKCPASAFSTASVVAFLPCEPNEIV